MAVSAWFDSGCRPSPRARWVEDRVEIENEGFLETPLPKDVLKWLAELQRASSLTGVPFTFLAGLMAAESAGKVGAVSHASAVGLMQLLPSTASHVAGRTVTAEELVANPELNVELGARYMLYQLNRYGQNPIKATAAYNAGGAYCTGNCLNRWGLRADCDPKQAGVGVDYPTRVFRYTNAASAAGVSGSLPRGGRTGLVLPLLIVGGAAAAVFAYRKRVNK